MPTHNLHWIEQIEALCGSANVGHVDLVVDQAGWDVSILPGLRVLQPGMSWFSLFSATPEEALLAQAPILMRINLDDWRHKGWLDELVRAAGHLSRLMVLISPLTFDALTKALQELSQLEWGGQSGLLRFYDPRVMPQLLANVLSPEQKEHFLRVALFWGWLDRDQHPVWQPGTYCSSQTLTEACPPMSLLDPQFERLGSISDAQSLLEIAKGKFPELSHEQCFARCYRVVRQTSRENYFGDLASYATMKFSSEDWDEGSDDD